MLNGRRANVRHKEFTLRAIDNEASKKSISIFSIEIATIRSPIKYFEFD